MPDANLASLIKNASSDAVLTDEQTTSTSYTDLTTPGPTKTVNVGASGKVLVIWGAGIYNVAASKYMGIAVSGANTIAPSDVDALRRDGGTAFDMSGTKFILYSSLNPGNTTFTAKYKTASGTAKFFGRSLIVIPL